MVKNKCSKYCCSICNEFFPHHRALNSHLRIHIREKRKAREVCEAKVDISTPVFSCRICSSSFQHYLALNSHMRLHRDRNRPSNHIKCPRCFKKFSNPSNLRKHMKKVKCKRPFRNARAVPAVPGKRSETLSTKLSNVESKDTGNLSQHSGAIALERGDITETKEEEFPVSKSKGSASDCPMQLRDPQTRSSNNMTTHKGLDPQLSFKKRVSHRYLTLYPCPYCSKAFTKTKLTEHMRVHTGEKPYHCRYCDLTFAQKGNLKRHEDLHPKDKPYRCGRCKKDFSSRQMLKKHNMEENCIFRYRNRDVLLSSRKQQKKKVIGIRADAVVKPSGREKLENGSDSGKTVVNQLPKRSRLCGKCGKTFRTLFSYRSHLCDRAADGRQYACNYCPNRYFFKHHLRRHLLRAHSEIAAAETQGKFCCLYCSKIFHNKKGFSNHIRIHTAPRSYKCKHCDRTFVNATLLKYHSARHSNKRPYSCGACGKKFKLPAYVRAHKKICRGATVVG